MTKIEENGNLQSKNTYSVKNVPTQFRDPNILCLKCGFHTKEPELGKPVKYYPCGSYEILAHVKMGYNVGATSLTGFAVFIDGDSQEVRDIIESHWDTTWWNTGTPGHRNYMLFLEDEPMEGPVPFKKEYDGYLKTRKGYSVIPPSIHPNGRMYGEEFNDVPVAIVNKSELIDLFKPFFKKDWTMKQEHRGHEKPDIGELKLKDMINLSRFRYTGRYYQGPHPIHGSKTGSNLEVNIDSNLWYCLRHGTGGSVLEWIAVSEGIIDCSESGPGAIKGMRFWEVVAKAHDRYGLSFDRVAKILEGTQ